MLYLIAKKTEGKDILKNPAKAAKTWPGVMIKDVVYIELALLCASLEDWPQVEPISEARLDELMLSGLEKLHSSQNPDDWERDADVYRVADSLTKVLAESDATVDAELAKQCGKAWSKFTRPPKSLASDIAELRKVAQQALKEKKCLFMLNDDELPEWDDATESSGDGEPMGVCHIWLGKFASEAALDKYFEENYDEDDDDAPINAFAKDQRATFYDHDMVERGFKKGDDLKKLIKGHSWSENYMSEVIALAAKQKITGANTFIMADKNEFKKPRSVKGKGYELWYLGMFECAGGKKEKSSSTESHTETSAGTRRFEFVEGASSKFWEIQVQGKAFHVRWGRMGTDGQKQTKSFSSDDDATKQAQKLIAEKLKKGYVEVE